MQPVNEVIHKWLTTIEAYYWTQTLLAGELTLMSKDPAW